MLLLLLSLYYILYSVSLLNGLNTTTRVLISDACCRSYNSPKKNLKNVTNPNRKNYFDLNLVTSVISNTFADTDFFHLKDSSLV